MAWRSILAHLLGRLCIFFGKMKRFNIQCPLWGRFHFYWFMTYCLSMLPLPAAPSAPRLQCPSWGRAEALQLAGFSPQVLLSQPALDSGGTGLLHLDAPGPAGGAPGC